MTWIVIPRATAYQEAIYGKIAERVRYYLEDSHAAYQVMRAQLPQEMRGSVSAYSSLSHALRATSATAQAKNQEQRKRAPSPVADTIQYLYERGLSLWQSFIDTLFPPSPKKLAQREEKRTEKAVRTIVDDLFWSTLEQCACQPPPGPQTLDQQIHALSWKIRSDPFQAFARIACDAPSLVTDFFTHEKFDSDTTPNNLPPIPKRVVDQVIAGAQRVASLWPDGVVPPDQHETMLRNVADLFTTLTTYPSD